MKRNVRVLEVRRQALLDERENTICQEPKRLPI